jgi:chemotaxis protein methyltransferase CheR
VLPAGQKRFQVWSAACATGEEPYSLAFYLADQYPASAGWDWRVLATDISTRALDHAAAGVYAADRLESVPAEWRRRYFQRGVGRWEGFYRVKRAIIERVTFQQLNLLGAYPFKGPFEAIFCRNVMIYFDRPTQEELVRHLAQLLVPGGHLMTGHAESLPGLSAGLRCVRPSIYRKD